MIGANHNCFNSVWASEGGPTITRAEQENAARVWIGAIARARLLSHSAYEEVLRDPRLATAEGWIPSNVERVTQYQDLERRFVDHFEQADPTAPSPPLTGTISTANMSSAELVFDTGPGGELYQETRGVALSWTATGGRYTIATTDAIPRGVLQYLVLRAGQGDDPLNSLTTRQDFLITLSDGTNAFTLAASTLVDLAFPAELDFGTRRVVMQTLRIPLQEFANHGVDVDHLRTIELAFDQPQVGTATVTGKLYMDEIQLSE